MSILTGRRALILAVVAVGGCGVKPPAEAGYKVQQVGYDQGLCRIGLDRCQSIQGFGAIDCVDRYQYCLSVLGPRGGYVPPSQRGFPPTYYPPAPPPPTVMGPPSPTEDVYYQKSDPAAQQPQQQQQRTAPGSRWGR